MISAVEGKPAQGMTLTDCSPLPHHSEAIFNKGCDALAAGHSRESCPYFGHTSRAAWLFGYDCAASYSDTGESA
jgi:ribosome modulation factor